MTRSPLLEKKGVPPLDVRPTSAIRAPEGKPTPAEDDAELETKISTRNLNFYYGDHQVLFENNLDIKQNRVTAIIGPSGCGKSTHIRVFNRIYEQYRGHRAPKVQRHAPSFSQTRGALNIIGGNGVLKGFNLQAIFLIPRAGTGM